MERRGCPAGVGWSFLLAVALLGVALQGARVLAAPSVPLGVRQDPLLAALGLLRVAVAVAAGYVATVTGLVLLGRAARAATLLRWARAISLPVLRRALAPVLGAALVVGAPAVVGRVPAAVAAEHAGATAVTVGAPETLVDDPPPVLRWLGPQGGTGTDDVVEHPPGEPADGADRSVVDQQRPPTGRVEVWSVLPVDPGGGPHDAPPAPPDAATMADRADDRGELPRAGGSAGDGDVEVGTPPGVEEAAQRSSDGAPQATSAGTGEATAADAAAGTHVVVSGESFWSIARELLAVELGRAPTDAEVVPVWRRLIEANHDRLVVPGEPDLIFPGQQLVLP